MKEPKKEIVDQLRGLLPELFRPTDRNAKTGRMCTPGSGCAPEAPAAETDILHILTRTAAQGRAEADKRAQVESVPLQKDDGEAD